MTFKHEKEVQEILERLEKKKHQHQNFAAGWSNVQPYVGYTSSYSTNTNLSGVESIEKKLVKMLESDEIKSLMDRLIQASISKNKAALLLLSKYDKDDNPVKVYIAELAKLAIVSLKEKENDE